MEKLSITLGGGEGYRKNVKAGVRVQSLRKVHCKRAFAGF